MSNKVLFGLMTFLFNGCGVPCFMQGHIKVGIIRILLSFVTCGVIGIINLVKGIILGIKILKMTDEEYDDARKEYITSGIPA